MGTLTHFFPPYFQYLARNLIPSRCSVPGFRPEVRGAKLISGHLKYRSRTLGSVTLQRPGVICLILFPVCQKPMLCVSLSARQGGALYTGSSYL